MTEIIKKNWNIILFLGIGLMVMIVGMFGLMGNRSATNYVSAANTTTTVGVTATVEPWLSISVDPSSVTLSPSLVDSAGDTHIGSSTANVAITAGTNAPGWSIGITGLNNGLATSTYDVIDSVALAASTTVAGGVDGYGANATNSIAAATVDSLYNGWATAKVGAIRTGSQPMVTGSSTSSQGVALMKVYAACDAAQVAGTYADTITLTITSVLE